MATTHAFFVAPIGPGSGLTSTCLGLVRALDRLGLRVRFYKPVRQPGKSQGPERSTEFVRRTTEFEPPEPFAFEAVETYLQAGGRDVLLEEIIGRYRQVAEGAEVVIVEGLVPTSDRPDAADLNRAVARALDAEIILVGAVGDGGFDELNDRLELNAEAFGGVRDDKVLGAIINRLGDPRVVTGSVRTARSEAEGVVDVDTLRARLPIIERDRFRLLGAVPWEQSLVSPRARDVAVHLGARVLNEGEIDRRRVVDVSLCARTVANMTHRLRPDALIITPADRDDVILATCMAALNGVPIAALLLTSGLEPDSRTVSLCARAFATGLPVLLVDTDSYMTAARVIAMDPEVPLDDTERIEAVMNTVAGYLDSEWLQARLATDLEPRQSPAAFRFRLVTRAREADRRIVLPEGEEARTVQAAATCQARGIARCLLLGKRERVLHQAQSQGLSLPDGIEIVDPDEVRERYVQPMVRLREHKGLTAPAALGQLEDNVVLGTMMLSEGEVDGLVSGAVHTTANTVRPALQLIKTRPGAKLISSIFFMLLPEQVLIFGDCAINPDPGAEELADIAIQSAESARAFGVPPRVAMISYSTLASGSGVDVDKVREATQLVRERRPDLAIDGPLQYDAATTPSVARTKAPDSPVAGRATVLIFPDLNTGNTTYKAVQRSAGVVSIGPMLQGLRRPVNDLSRGATVEDIVYTIALTAIQAAQGEEPQSSGEAGGVRPPGGRL